MAYTPYNYAAILHDYLYWTHACSQDNADRLYYEIMKRTSVGWVTRNIHYGVLWGVGKRAYDASEQEQKEGFSRFVYLSDLNDIKINNTCAYFRDKIRRRGQQPDALRTFEEKIRRFPISEKT
ncbi:DUF1353 domain-containing protein [Azospirillum sp. A26]|uniref:DUF1353 domain-containing protein n=1 Tax=Azospirillum sp. A26 TaxID=3160607 RepID=UPI00366C6B38